MPRTKRMPNQNQLRKAASVAGVVGASMALGGGAYATGVADSSPDMSARDTTLGPQINLSEEELSDVSLGTFYVFDKEDLSMAGAQYAARCGRCGGAGRCGGVARPWPVAPAAGAALAAQSAVAEPAELARAVQAAAAVVAFPGALAASFARSAVLRSRTDASLPGQRAQLLRCPHGFAGQRGSRFESRLSLVG